MSFVGIDEGAHESTNTHTHNHDCEDQKCERACLDRQTDRHRHTHSSQPSVCIAYIGLHTVWPSAYFIHKIVDIKPTDRDA